MSAANITIRPYQDADLEQVIAAINGAAQGDPYRMVSAYGMREAFSEAGYDRLRDGFVASDDDRNQLIVGFCRFWTRQKRHDPHPIMQFEGAVHPDYADKGVKEMLFDRLFERCAEAARETGESGFVVQVRVFERDTADIQLLESMGFTLNRHLVTMERPHMDDIEEPEFPKYIDVRPYRVGIDDEGWYAALEDSFDEHWGQMVMPFVRWQQIVHRQDYRPALSLVAWDTRTNEIAGFSYNKVDGDTGTLRWLGVRPGWRRQGLANALTRAGLLAMRDAGAQRALTGADYESDTGPARVYMRNGYEIVRKELAYHREFTV